MYDIKPKLSKDGRKLIFPEDFCYSEELYNTSKELFETPLAKSYMSQFRNGRKKNIHCANVLKMCVLLGCSPNDLFDWQNWDKKVNNLYVKKGIVTNKDISEIL